MSPSPQLAPAGSSTYSSNTMFVGDGTWDTQRNTFLLPNLVGLNFDTMRYNGMGDRFAELTQYHSLILGHGIVAAITFLIVVPAAIFFARFYVRNPVWALRLHIWLQILTVLLTTVVFVLGYIAVGPERSLTNPHHGIGLALYVMVLFQFIFGWWIHHKEKGRRRMFIPLKLMTHQWLGRAIALLGIAQIPLGLTLYGSPLALFIIFALAAFALLVAYFTLSHLHERRLATGYGSSYSYGSGSVVEERRASGGGLANLAKAGAAGAGLAALGNRFRNRSTNRREQEVVGSRRHSGSYLEEEKYSQYGRDPGREGGWTDRLLKIGAVAGAATLAKRFFDRRKVRDRDSDTASNVYGPPLGGATAADYGPPGPNRPPGGPMAPTEMSEDTLARVEEGRVPIRPSGQHPLNQQQPLNHHRRSTSSYSYDTYMSAEDAGRHGHGVRDAVAGLGAFGLVRSIFKNRRERKEQQRVGGIRQQEFEEERIARENSQRRRHAGDGYPRRTRPQGTVTEGSDFSTATDARLRHNDGAHPLIPAGVPPPPGYIPPPGVLLPAAAGAAAGVSFADERNRAHPGTSLGANNPVLTGAIPAVPFIPPIPPTHHESSGSEAYLSAGGRHHRRHHPGGDAAAGLAAGEALAARRERHHSATTGEGSMASPPVSVKVKMHSDGRHVTLRRLPEEEAAAERAARRQSRERSGGRRHRRPASGSSITNTDVPATSDRWRRSEAIERQQAAEEAIRVKNQRAAETSTQGFFPPQPPPPPPPAPPAPSSSLGVGGPGASGFGMPSGSVGSPGEASDYASNAKRRRAERAQARLAREGRAAGGGGSADFV